MPCWACPGVVWVLLGPCGVLAGICGSLWVLAGLRRAPGVLVKERERHRDGEGSKESEGVKEPKPRFDAPRWPRCGGREKVRTRASISTGRRGRGDKVTMTRPDGGPSHPRASYREGCQDSGLVACERTRRPDIIVMMLPCVHRSSIILIASLVLSAVSPYAYNPELPPPPLLTLETEKTGRQADGRGGEPRLKEQRSARATAEVRWRFIPLPSNPCTKYLPLAAMA